ncbi:MAG TPA: type II toxin-antitoxin system VapC family toxin [Candidatus Obscuribacterales bacterium]
MNEFVLDASVALSWFFIDEGDPYAAGVLERLLEHEAVVPPVWPLEVANGLLVAERRRRATVAQTSQAMEQLRYLPIHIDEGFTMERLEMVVALARAQMLSCYDAAYLELAIRGGLPLASMDEKLIAAAESCGVSRFT